nr:hypothetical protein GCM10020093_013850 [Planobispora longispora]
MRSLRYHREETLLVARLPVTAVAVTASSVVARVLGRVFRRGFSAVSVRASPWGTAGVVVSMARPYPGKRRVPFLPVPMDDRSHSRVQGEIGPEERSPAWPERPLEREPERLTPPVGRPGSPS